MQHLPTVASALRAQPLARAGWRITPARVVALLRLAEIVLAAMAMGGASLWLGLPEIPFAKAAPVAALGLLGL